MKKYYSVLMAGLLATSMAACGTATSEGTPATTTATPEAVVEVEPTPEAVESAGVVGEWHLVKVSSQATPESDILELPEEENQSFYAEASGSFTLNEDGTGTRTVVDGADTVVTDLTWTADGDKYTVVEDGTSTEYIYDADADVICRKLDDSELGEVTFVYVRVAADDAEATEAEAGETVVEAEDVEDAGAEAAEVDSPVAQ
jgi:hypothetical protein